MRRDEATLIILAGGASRRMGWPKHLLPTSCGRLIDHLSRRLGGAFAETLVVGRDLDLAPGGFRVVTDARPEQSPLVGIYSGLRAAGTDLCFILACDLPFAKPELIRYLLSRGVDVDVAVPIVRGYYEPLFAVYQRSATSLIEATLDRGVLKVTAAYDRLRVGEVPEADIRRIDPSLSSFINLNVPSQLRHLTRLPPS